MRLIRFRPWHQFLIRECAIADELLELKRGEDKAPVTLNKLEWLFGLAKPELGSRPITAIDAPEVLRLLRLVESRGRLETAGGVTKRKH